MQPQHFRMHATPTVTLLLAHVTMTLCAPDAPRLDLQMERTAHDKYYRARVGDQALLDMYQKWVDTGLSSLMSAIAEKNLKRKRRNVVQRYGECSAAATDLLKHAKCLSQLLNHKFADTEKRKKGAKTGGRLDRYGPRTDGSRGPFVVDGEVEEEVWDRSDEVVEDVPNDRVRWMNEGIANSNKRDEQQDVRIKARQRNNAQKSSLLFKYGKKQRYPEEPQQAPESVRIVVSGETEINTMLKKEQRRFAMFKKYGTKKASASIPNQISTPEAKKTVTVVVNNNPLTESPLRTKRSIPSPRSQATYNIKDGRPRLTPLGHVAKALLESVKVMNNKTELPAWQKTVDRIRVNGAKRLKYKKLVEEDSEESMNQMALSALQKKPAQELAEVEVEELTREPDKLKRLVETRKGKLSKEEKVVEVIRQAMKLAYGLAGQNTTDFEHKNLKLVSPRFLGVTKEEKKEDEISLVSPSLFSLHSEGEGIENLTSIPNLLQGLGAEGNLWLDLVMEAAGVNKESDKLEDQVREFEYNKTVNVMMNISRFVDEDGTPMYATKQNATDLGFDKDYIELFERLHSNYSKAQMREMNSTGYSVLSRDQIEMLYGPSSPFANRQAYQRFMNLSEGAVHEQLHDDLHQLAERESFSFRARDIVLSPIVLTNAAILAPALASQPFVLSPIVLTPLILSPAVFGAVVLSPWLFVPVVLAPRVLGTLILSPFVLSPLILSPFALHPAVLSPGLFSPLVLSPFLLLPLILSPQVFTPIILSPLCLSPIILNPMLGSPLILSPFVLSPIVASPQILSALVLSPYALSPVLYSPLIAFIAVLSPSWLS